MPENNNPKTWEPDHCGMCGQSTNYLQPLDRGTADIVKAVANAVRLAGKNDVDLSKLQVSGKLYPTYDAMIADGKMTWSMRNNASKARAHGLLARLNDKAGHWCLTKKGAAFLRGEKVQRYAVMSKAEKRQVGYLDDGTPASWATIGEMKGAYWDIHGFGETTAQTLGI